MLKYNSEYAKIPDIPCEKIACVLTANNKEFIDKWLRAWNNAEHYGVKLAVIHEFEGDNPSQDEVDNILKHNPDFYIPIYKTSIKDFGALIAIFRDIPPLPDWNTLFWFADYVVPFDKTFLRPFVEKIADPEVGLVAQYCEQEYIKINACATKRLITKKLIFPDNIEQLENNILGQILDMGYKFEHITSNIWNCLEKPCNIYEYQFENWKTITKASTLLSIDQCEKLTSIPNKICALIPTCQSTMNTFMWSIFSLLINSTPDGILEHIIVGINGADDRTGDTSLQDKKQRFLEELRKMKWHYKDMPLTVVRTWSRIGHAQTLEQLTPWVHTEHYLSMHDDVIVLSKKWEQEAIEFFNNENAIMQSYGDIMFNRLVAPGSSAFSFPHVNTVFTLCKKPLMKKLGENWTGYHIPAKFKVKDLIDYQQFSDWHKKHNFNLDENGEYGLISMDVGAFIFVDLLESKYTTTEFSKDTVLHFIAGSWRRRDEIANETWLEVISLEEKLKEFPDFYNLYLKYRD